MAASLILHLSGALVFSSSIYIKQKIVKEYKIDFSDYIVLGMMIPFKIGRASCRERV